MSYSISQYSFKKAKSLGVTIKPSTRKNKKIDVFDKDGKKLASIGDMRYLDYSMYIKQKGKAFADKRKSLYRVRHGRVKDNKGTPGYFAYRILW